MHHDHEATTCKATKWTGDPGIIIVNNYDYDRLFKILYNWRICFETFISEVSNFDRST